MNNTINKNIEAITKDFVDTVLKATENEKKEKKLLNEIPNKLNELQKISIAPKDIPDRFKEFFNDFFQKMAEINNKQKQEIENRLKVLEELLYTRYRNRTIVVIYGIVKAGKSALGNFIIGRPFEGLKDSPYENLNFKIETWDEKGGHLYVDKLEELDEDVLEATKNIHTIEMGGMVWVDTPGLGSLSKHYGEKARNFMNNADVIIFLTDSNNVLTNTDLEELKNCALKHKRLIVLISKSDNHEEDYINEAGEIVKGALIPKSTRKQQEKFVMEELSKREDISKSLEIKEVFSISTKLAIVGLKEGDVKKFKDSNLEKFYNLLKELVVERREKLKRENIESQIRGPVDEILSNIGLLENLIKDKLKVVDKVKEDLTRKKQELHDKLSLKLDLILHKASSYERKRFEKRKKGENIKPYPIQEEVNNTVKELLEESINNILNNTLKTIAQIQKINGDIQIKSKEKTETKEYKIKRKSYYVVERDPRGLWEWGKKIITIGTAKFYESKEDVTEEVVKDTISYFDSDSFKEEFDKKIKLKVKAFADEEFERIRKEIIDTIENELNKQKQSLEAFRQKVEEIL